MFRNYFTIAWRNLKKHTVFSIVNITGLALGLAVFWLIGLYVTDELSYDRSYANANRIYRVVHVGSWSEGRFKLAPTSAPFAPALQHDYSEIEAAARIDPEGGGILQYGDKKLKTDDIYFTDPAIFTLFGYSFLYGSPKDALTKPQSIVLTRSLAVRLFGKAENALHKTVLFENNFSNIVTGVIEDVPANSHLVFSALRSFPANYTDRWSNFSLYTYILLHKDADPKKLEAKLPGFYNRYLQKDMGKIEYRMELQSLPSIHLHSNLQYELSSNGDMRHIYIFSLVALLVLVIAVINYVNLSTARSSMRVKEVGVRKVIGSGRRQLIMLFLAESLLFTLLAVFIAGGLCGILLPFFNQLSGKALSLWQFGIPVTLSVLAAFSLLTGLVGGIYPALFLSGFRTIGALKGQIGDLHSTTLFRKSLVTFQFVITIAMIAGSAIIYQQLHYMLTRDLGFNKDQVLTLHINDHSLRKNIPALTAQLLQDPLIESVAAASNPIGNNNIGTSGFNFEINGRIDREARVAQYFMVDENYLPTLQIRLLQGRNFEAGRPTDKDQSILVNETLVKELGWADPIGKRVQFQADPEGHIGEATVIGVVKDFNIYSLQHKIAPLVLRMPPVDNEKDNLYVRVSKTNVAGALKGIEKVFRKFDTGSPFEYHFLDANFAGQYEAEQKQGSLIITLTILAILIACLGLFGLVAFSAEQRRKEIGIRKVLGATIPSLLGLLSKDLIKLVILAMLIASPIAWFIMQRWLNSFPYRIAVSSWIFVLAGLLTVVIALATISVQAIKAAMGNPVKSLRTE